MDELRAHKILIIVSYVAYAFAAGLIYFLVALAHNFDQSALTIVDGLTIAGVVVICFGLIGIVNRFGAFDPLSYGLRLYRVHLIPGFDNSKDKYKDYYDYRERKKEERTKFRPNILPWAIIGGGLLIAAIIVRTTCF